MLTARESRERANTAKAAYQGGEEILLGIIKKINEESGAGRFSLYLEGKYYYSFGKTIETNYVLRKLTDLGYIVKPQQGTETEHTCFGAGDVTTFGLMINW